MAYIYIYINLYTLILFVQSIQVLFLFITNIFWGESSEHIRFVSKHF